MKPTSSFLPRVLPYVLGCTDPMAKQAVVDAAIEFCQRTNAVWTTFTASSRVGVSEYDIDVPTQMVTSRLLDVYFNDRKLRIVDSMAVDDPYALRGAVDGVDPESGAPLVAYAMQGTATFTVYPVPDEAIVDVFTCKASFQPTRAATQLDDTLYDRYLDTIASGAIAYLASLPGQSFTSLGVYKMHRDKFYLGIGSAVSDARKGASMTSTRVKSRAFI